MPFLLSILLLLITATTFATGADAAEVRNLQVGQNGDKGFATYDLIGKIGEQETDVVVTLTINGHNYAADRLTLSGNLGKKVKPGGGKRIIWDILADLPTGFDGEVLWTVDAKNLPPIATTINEAKPMTAAAMLEEKHPFVFSEKTARDKKTGLIWLREISRGGKPGVLMNARSYALSLNKEKLADCLNWRLPTNGELRHIIAYAKKAGYAGNQGDRMPADFFNAIGFSSVTNAYYWTGIGTPVKSSAVDLEDGIQTVRSVEEDLHYWPVCKP